jgi:glycine/D-amino acid oxidase-like deaminating enzyme
MLLTRRNMLIAAGMGATAIGAGVYELSGPGGNVRQGRSRAKPVATDSMPPAGTEVVIIGGGIIGASTAFYLAKAGIPVVLCEKGVIAGEASCRSVGQVASAGLAPIKMPLLSESKRLWNTLNGDVNGETGYRRNGYLAPFSSSRDQGEWEAWFTSVRDAQPDARLLSAAETSQYLPHSGPWLGAYLSPSDGCAEPTLAAPAIVEAARHLGAKIVAPCAVRSVDTQAGRVTGVMTERGPIKANSVVLAGGCWSSLFCRNLGLPLPLLNVFAMCTAVNGVDGPQGSGDAPTVSWRKQIDGGYTVGVIGGVVPIVPQMARYGLQFLDALHKVHWDIKPNLSRYFFEELMVPRRWSPTEISPFEKRRILEPTANTEIVERGLREIVRVLPVFKSLKVTEVWSGALVTSPDNMPTLGPVASIPGLYLAAGFSYGLTMAPAAGQLMAELVTGKTPSFDPKPYRYDRFVDGSKLIVYD